MNKIKRRLRRKRGIRKKIFGTDLKPRITEFKSNRHLYVQAIDDVSGSTLSASSDLQSGVKRNRKGAQKIGEDLSTLDAQFSNVKSLMDAESDKLEDVDRRIKEIRDNITDYLYSKTKRRPMVLPVVIEV